MLLYIFLIAVVLLFVLYKCVDFYEQIEIINEDSMFFFPRKKMLNKKNVANNYNNNDCSKSS
jgi:hypothetical protein